ncbi:hypothetical protein BGZ65_000523, partial [Modicella reniformis]
LKFRHWLETLKSPDFPAPAPGASAAVRAAVVAVAGVGANVAAIESNLPSLDKDPAARATTEDTVNELLDTFYNKNDSQFLKYSWDARKAHIGEFDLVTDRLLSMIGDSSGQKRRRNHKAIIAIGQFAFGSHGLWIIVVGINEYYTSKRCPNCKREGTESDDFVGITTMRRLFCRRCRTPFHRDVMAASNMTNA